MVRLFALAKELGVDVKVILEFARDNGYQWKNTLVAINDEEAAFVKNACASMLSRNSGQPDAAAPTQPRTVGPLIGSGRSVLLPPGLLRGLRVQQREFQPIRNSDFLQIIRDDLNEVREMLRIRDSEVRRRQYLMICFAALEAVVAHMREAIDDFESTDPEAYSSSPVDVIETVEKYSRLGKFSCRIYDDLYTALRQCRYARNRVTHPREHTGVAVSSETVSHVNTIAQWIDELLEAFGMLPGSTEVSEATAADAQGETPGDSSELPSYVSGAV